MILSVLCYAPPAVEQLGPTIPQFSNPDPRSPSFQSRLTPLMAQAQVFTLHILTETPHTYSHKLHYLSVQLVISFDQVVVWNVEDGGHERAVSQAPH